MRVGLGAYDRTYPLATGEVRVSGFEVDVELAEPSDVFRGMLEEEAYDVSEMSMAAFLHFSARADNPFVAVPVFPSRAFRHGMVLVRPDGGIAAPADLNGRTIVVREWGMTAVLWVIGLLQDDYGFDLRSCNWLCEQPARGQIAVPDGVKARVLGEGESVAALIEAQAIDAALLFNAPEAPAADGQSGGELLQPLFPDVPAEERRFYERTGIHPIMHTIVFRRELVEAHPTLPGAIQAAMHACKQLAHERLLDGGTLSAMVPFLSHAVADTRTSFGEDWWPYGVDDNRPGLERMCRYAHEQGLTGRLLDVDELFIAV